jgi:hypothetical protein
VNALLAALLAVQSGAEVRQLVSFQFLPGKSAEAFEVFLNEARPLYQANLPMIRFRAYREAESPEPLDLVVISSFHGMSGMDASNRALAEEAARRGTSVSAVYGKISASTIAHRDEFMEMDPGAAWGDADSAPLLVLVRVRAAPGRRSEYARLIRERVVPWEKEERLLSGSETGRFLVSNGLDFLRVLGLSSLGGFQRYLDSLRRAPFAPEIEEWTAESREVILAPVRELSVR